MAERPIRLLGDPVLRSVCDPIAPGDPRAAALVADLLETVRVPGRAGLAANQIGVVSRAFSYNVDGVVGYVINPVLADLSGEPTLVDEGCLSVPGFSFPRTRHPFARVIGVDLDGAPIEVSGEGLLAQALQHEVDHLNGHLYLEELAPETKKEAMRLIRMAPWWSR